MYKSINYHGDFNFKHPTVLPILW